jgi:hypothetical protein
MARAAKTLKRGRPSFTECLLYVREHVLHLLDADRDADQPVELLTNVKYRFYNNEENGVAASAGAVLR